MPLQNTKRNKKEICIGNEMNKDCKKVSVTTANKTIYTSDDKDEWESF